MNEVKRYTFKGAAGEYVYAPDHDRVTAERDGLQLSLTTADQTIDDLQTAIARRNQRIDELERGKGQPVAVVLPDRLGSPESIKAVLDSVGRAGRVSYWDARDIWNACLDAVAAKLNIPK